MSSKCTLPDAVAYADGTAEPSCTSATASGTTTIVVPASSVPYTVTSTLDLTRATIIRGDGAASTVISGGGQVEVFRVSSSAATIEDLTVTDGVSGDATTGCSGIGKFRSCPAEPGLDGGGIYNSGTLVLQNDLVRDNTASAGTLPVGIRTCFAGCTGESAGSSGFGGGIENTGNLQIENSTITGNHAADGTNATGGVTASGGGPGEAGGFGGDGGWGGGVDSSGSLTISNSTISDNTAGDGGNAGAGSAATVSGDNGGDAGQPGRAGQGGGVASANASFTISTSTIAGNSAGAGGWGADGGAPDGGSPGTSQNGSQGGNGGGVFTASIRGSSSLTDVTVTGNLAPSGGVDFAQVGQAFGGSGGGIYDIGTMDLGFVTVAGNIGSFLGDGVATQGGSIHETGSIITSNLGSVAGNCTAQNATIVDGGGNVDFVDTGQNCPGADVNPRLDPLANNGGPTKTMALGAGSGAIGLVPSAECSPPIDQRGISRPASDCDAGAYQFAPPAISNAKASAISPTSASVTASINPNLSAEDTTVTVRYGTTSAYGSTTPAKDIGRGKSPVAFTVTLNHLSPGTTYFVEVVARNGDGITTAQTSFPTESLVRVLSASTSGTVLSLTLGCMGSPGQRCHGDITLTGDHEPVGHGSYSLRVGSTRPEKLTLNAVGTRLLAQHHKLTAELSLSGSPRHSHVTFR